MHSTLQARLKLPRPFKAAGGKTWLVESRLFDLWKKNTKNEHRRLFDPFVGGGALPFLLQPDRCYLADANPHLVCGYHWLQQGAPRNIPFEFTEASYNALRDELNATDTDTNPLWIGEAFYILNRTCYGGIWRVNGSGKMNVKWGNYKKMAPIDLPHYATLTQPWAIAHQDFRSACKNLEPDDFLFFDPPYDGTFDGYTKKRFTWADQEDVAAIAAAHPGPVVVCNAVTDRIVKLYGDHGLTVDIIPSRQAIQNGKSKSVVPYEVFAHRNLGMPPNSQSVYFPNSQIPKKPKFDQPWHEGHHGERWADEKYVQRFMDLYWDSWMPDFIATAPALPLAWREMTVQPGYFERLLARKAELGSTHSSVKRAETFRLAYELWFWRQWSLAKS